MPTRNWLRGGAHRGQARRRDARPRLRGDREGRQHRRRRDLSQRRRADRAGAHRDGRAADGREDRPALREQGQDRVERPRDLRRAQLRPRRAHGGLAGHGAHAGRAEGPVEGHADVRRPAGRGDRVAAPRRCWPTACSRASASPTSRSRCTPRRRPTASSATAPGPISSNSDGLEITFKGRGGHGSAPDKTIDPILIAARFVTDVQTRGQPREGPGRVRRRDHRRDPGRHRRQHHPGHGHAARHDPLATSRRCARSCSTACAAPRTRPRR